MDMGRIRREKFCDNNARVLSAINTLRTKYVRIRDLEYGLEVDVSAAEISDCVNYLNEGGYIKASPYSLPTARRAERYDILL